MYFVPPSRRSTITFQFLNFSVKIVKKSWIVSKKYDRRSPDNTLFLWMISSTCECDVLRACDNITYVENLTHKLKTIFFCFVLLTCKLKYLSVANRVLFGVFIDVCIPDAVSNLHLRSHCWILFASNWICYIYLINNISVNAGAFAYTILPIATAFIAHFTIKERLSKLKDLD